MLWASPAAADPAADARAKFAEGRDLFRRREYTAARAAFEEANRILPNPRVWGNIAACYEGEENAAAAVRTYRKFLYEGGDGIAAPARDGAQRAIDRLRPRVGDLVFAVEPVGAEIRVDGEVLGSAPLPWPVAVGPGARLVEVRAYGHSPYSSTVQAAAGGEVSVRVVLESLRAAEPEPAAPPATTAAPATDPELDPPTPPSRTETPLGRGPLVWVGAGLSIALALGGTVTGVLALSAEDAANERSRPVADRRDDADRADSLATVTDVLVDSAVVVGAATLVLVLFAGPDEVPERHAFVSPTLTPGGLRCDFSWVF